MLGVEPLLLQHVERVQVLLTRVARHQTLQVLVHVTPVTRGSVSMGMLFAIVLFEIIYCLSYVIYCIKERQLTQFESWRKQCKIWYLIENTLYINC